MTACETRIRRGRSVAIALGLAVAVALGAAAPAWACDNSRHFRAGKVRGERAPLVIGDSTMIFAAPVLARLGLEADARGCRQFSQGLAILSARRRAGTLPPVVVLALGANGPVGPAGLARARRIIGRHRVLALVTPRNSASSRASMRRAARRHPERVKLVDWAVYSAGHGGWFGGDGLHVNHTGAAAFARFIKRAVGPLAFPPVRAFRLPRSTKDVKACDTVRRAGRRYAVYVTRGPRRVLCRRARELVRMPLLRPIANWRYYDWRRARNGPWAAVYARRDRRVIVAAVRVRR